MLATFSFVTIGLIFGKKDLAFLYENEQWAGFFLYIALLSIGLVLVVLYDLGVTIPTPIEPIQKLIEFFIE